MRALEKLALAVTLVAVPHAQAQQPVTREQLNGEWTGTLVLDNSSPRIALVFRLTDSTFAGVAYADGDSLGEMQDGSLVGNQVHFKVDRFDFTGTITGVSMKIDLIVFNGSTRTFVVRKSPRLTRWSRPPGSHGAAARIAESRSVHRSSAFSMPTLSRSSDGGRCPWPGIPARRSIVDSTAPRLVAWRMSLTL